MYACVFNSRTQVSQLREMPEGSAEITTTLIPVDKVGQIVDRLKSRDASDDKVGLVYVWMFYWLEWCVQKALLPICMSECTYVSSTLVKSWPVL